MVRTIDQQNYRANPNLRRSGIAYNFSGPDIQEFIRCRDDIDYFASHYVKILHPDKGLMLIPPYPYQKRLLPILQDERFVIVKNPRQSGKTTTAIIFLLHFIIFNRGKTVGILANKADVSREILGRLQLAYENLPTFLQQGVVEWNKGSIELENDCRVYAFATASSAARSYSFSVIYIDEAAFIPNNIWDPYWKSVYPTITAGQETKVIIVSTPNGMNHFYKFWKDAEAKRNMFRPFSIEWNDVPGRDEQWKIETIKNVGQESWQQEFETEFIGSSNTLIRPTTLKTLTYVPPISTSPDFSLSVYEEPIKDHIYVIPVDTSQGIGQDYCAFSVIDITEAPYRIAATFRDNEVSTLVYPEIIERIARDYNEAQLLVEINEIGGQVATSLHQDLEYENMVTCQMRGRAGQIASGGFSQGSYVGVRNTKTVKKIGCAILRNLVEEHILLIPDFNIISELTSFTQKGDSFEAEVGCNDDLVIGLVLFSWLTTQAHFKELTNINIKGAMYSNKIKAIEEELVPFTIDDGVEPVEEDNEFSDTTIWLSASDNPVAQSITYNNETAIW